jgi:hypothetical protein
MNPVQALRTRIDQFVAMTRRATLGPSLVRATVAVAAFASFVVAYPLGILGARALLAFAAIAFLPALWPRGPMPTMAMLVAAAGWLINGAGFDVRTSTFMRMCAMALLLYLIHTGSALAAVLPYDAIIARGVFAPWLLRGMITLLLTGVFAVFAVGLPGFAHGQREVIASIGGLLVTLAITGYLSLLGRPRGEG